MSAVKPSVENREAELIRRVCAGDREAFYDLVHPYERALFTAAMAILNNPADAEEATQEAVVKGLAALPKFRGEAKFSTWLVQITINEARLKRRKDRRHLYESLDEPYADEEGDYRPKDLADWREIPSETLQLGVGVGCVKTRLLRARLQMRDALAPGMDGRWSTGAPGYGKVRTW